MTPLQAVPSTPTSGDNGLGKSYEPESADLFEEFWLLYPRRVAKRDARRAWERLGRGEKISALSALVDWRALWLTRNDDLEFVPYPASWLNGERWEDELPRGYRRAGGNGARPEPAAPFVKGEIPDHVRAALARLKQSRP